MSVPYSVPLRQLALRAGMLRGSQVYGIDTSYLSTPLTKAELSDGPYPLQGLKDALLSAEEALANAIADTGNHPWRAYLLSETAALSTGDPMPSVDVNDDPIIGIYGSVVDGADTTLICTEQPTEVIRRWKQSSGYWVIPFYYYSLDGNGITHTRTTVKVQVCVYNRATQSAAVDANDPMLLPDTLEEAMVAGGVAKLNAPNAAIYATMFNATLASIRAGLASVAAAATGGPSMVREVST